MKLTITGKGGTGKTTLSGLLAHFFARDGYHVLTVDADPDSNLASALGIPSSLASSIIPLSQQRELISKRTGAKSDEFGQMFKLNPTVKDIPDKFCTDFRGIKLIVMGAVQKGGAGCACPENVFLRSFLSEIFLNRNEVILVDMEAGIEHLGRGTAGSIDKMLIVVEPGFRSIQTAKTIMKLGRDIGLESYGIIGNKVKDEQQKLWIEEQFSPSLVLGTVSYHEIIQASDINQKPLIDLLDEELKQEFQRIYSACLDVP